MLNHAYNSNHVIQEHVLYCKCVHFYFNMQLTVLFQHSAHSSLTAIAVFWIKVLLCYLVCSNASASNVIDFTVLHNHVQKMMPAIVENGNSKLSQYSQLERKWEYVSTVKAKLNDRCHGAHDCKFYMPGLALVNHSGQNQTKFLWSCLRSDKLFDFI